MGIMAVAAKEEAGQRKETQIRVKNKDAALRLVMIPLLAVRSI
jgi:hypothetical protein